MLSGKIAKALHEIDYTSDYTQIYNAIRVFPIKYTILNTNNLIYR